MEISVGNSEGSKTKSLDLKTLYKSEVSNKEGSVNKETSSWLGNGEGTDSKKRKNTKDVAISSFEDLAQSKKVKHSTDDTEVDAQPSGLVQKINGGGGFNAIGGDGHGVPIPKRPRGTFGRSKFAKSHLLNPSAAVEKVAKLKDDSQQALQNEVLNMVEPMDDKASSAEPIVKLNGKSVVKATPVVNSKGNRKQDSAAVTSSQNARSDSGDLAKSIDSLGTKVKQEIIEISLPVADAPVSSSSLGSKDQVANSTNDIPAAPVSSNSTSVDQIGKLNGNSNGKVRNNAKKKEDSAVIGSDLVVNFKDSSAKRNRRKRKMLGSNVQTVAKKVVASIDLDPDDDLEQNAARMLSSRFDPNCTGFASKNRTSALNGESFSENPTANSTDFASGEAADRVLRPRRQLKGKGTSRKRRHFYEIHSDDMDAHWFLNRKIKIFWPLDESWYYGLVNDYDAEKNLHHIKYDDRDEEWISLENERFKLLLLPNEVPGKQNNKDTAIEDTQKEDFMASHMESEPIISWLARSSHRVKSSSLKKQKLSHFSSDNSLDVYNNGNMSLLERETDKRKNESEGNLPIVYVRRRFRRFSDAACLQFVNDIGTELIESKRYEVCISLWPMLTYVLGVDILWLVRSILLFQYGSIVTLWPNVFLEVLFVDNNVGLRLFLFEGCLKQAVAFVFLVMKAFCEPEKDESVDKQIPMTSIRFKLSFFRNFRNEKVFAFYSFLKVRDSIWNYLLSEFQPHCLLTKQLSLSECTYDKIKLLEGGMQHSDILLTSQTTYFEVSPKKSNPGNRPSTVYSLRHGNLPPFALSFTAAPNYFFTLHLKLLMERSITSVTLQDHDSIHPPLDNCSHVENQLEVPSESSSKSHEIISSSEDATVVVVSNDESQNKSTQLVIDPTSSSSKPCIQTVPMEIRKDHALKRISVEIPTSDEVYKDCRKTTPGTPDLTWNLSDGIICSPNPTAPRSLWHRNKTDFIGNGFGNGPKKPRTQVQYSMPSRELNIKNKGHSQMGLPYQRIRKANDKKTLSDASKGPRRNLEMVACDANILINGGDKGWRECGARIFLEAADQNEWKLAVKCNGELKYAYKVHQDLQPGSTNRYTHAMMWKGGKDWALEFPDRSQWFLFKEMHEECHNRNIRAASIKNIPIPGVRLIEDPYNDEEDMGFVRSPWYFRQVRNDVEMAMDASHVAYDMDSEDEEWVVSRSEEDMISDELFEKVMDMLEKVSYAQKRDHFTCAEIEDLVARISPVEVAKSIYEHWREKRQRKGMPLIRQLQPPLWERYQQICREWDELNPKATTGVVSGSQEKASAADKPPMFAFCLKPRGLELLNKGSKHRPHKKMSLSGHSHAFLGDHDNHHSSGRRVNAFGDERAESSDVSPLLAKARDATAPPHFSLDGGGGGGGGDDWNHQLRIQRNNPRNPKLKKAGKRNSSSAGVRKSGGEPYRHPGQLMLGGSDLDEFRLRDASSAAKHARNMAKLKRERAQKLMLSADLAIHKAVSALMTAEAIRASQTQPSTT